jgi:hypothetical protein
MSLINNIELLPDDFEYMTLFKDFAINNILIQHTKKKLSNENYKKIINECKKKLADNIIAIRKTSKERIQRLLKASEKLKERNRCNFESEDEVVKKYPNLGGRYFVSLYKTNVNYMVSNDMNDMERDELFVYWDQGQTNITICKCPNYVQINRFRFVADDVGDIIVVRLSDEKYYKKIDQISL